MIVKKGTLDSEVARILGMNRRKVSEVTEAFLEVVREHVTDLDTVWLNGLGQLRVFEREVKVSWLTDASGDPTTKKKYYVSFKKSPRVSEALRRKHRLKEKVMEKYGVDEQQAENEKRASDGCPECGRKAERHGNVLACPVHGTEPFETKQP